MAFCRKCGTQLSDETNFCPKCGTPCNSSFNLSTGESGVIEQKKTPKVSIKVLIAVILVIILIGGGWFAWKGLSNVYSLEGLAKACIKYDWVSDFHEGLARVGKADKFGYIDKNGVEVIPCIYDAIEEDRDWNFHEGLALVYKDGKYSYINRNGEAAFSIDCDGASHFSEGLAFVDIGSSYGYIDTKGKVVFTLSKSDYSWGGSFSEGLAAVYNEEDKLGFIDSRGVLIIPMVYEKEMGEMEASVFHDGLAPVMKDGKWGYIDKTGSEVIPFIFGEASDFSEGLAAVYKDGKFGYIDKTGNEKIAFQYNRAWNFTDGLAIVVKDSGWGFIDKSGKEVVSCIYDFADDFNDGLAPVGKNGKCGYINKVGTEVIPSIYNFVTSFSEGLASVEKDDHQGYVDLKGNSTFDVKDENLKKSVEQTLKEKEEQRREEEEKRKKYEEEHGATGTFNSIAKNNHVWKHVTTVCSTGTSYFTTLYFYPINGTKGKVSIIQYGDNGRGGFLIFKQSKSSMYEIINDIIYIGESFEKFYTGEIKTLELTIVKNNDFNVELRDNGSQWEFDMITPEFKDPIE